MVWQKQNVKIKNAINVIQTIRKMKNSLFFQQKFFFYLLHYLKEYPKTESLLLLFDLCQLMICIING